MGLFFHMLTNADTIFTMGFLFALYHVSSNKSLGDYMFQGLKYLDLVEDTSESSIKKKRTKHNKNKPGKLLLRQGEIIQGFFASIDAYEKCESLLYFSIVCLVAFIFSESWVCITQQSHSNFSFFLILISLLLCWYFLLKTVIQFGWKTWRVKISFFFGIIMSILAFMLLRSPDVIDINLKHFEDFGDGINTHMRNMKITTQVHFNFIYYQIFLALGAGLLAGMYIWPSLHFAKAYQHSIDDTTHNGGEIFFTKMMWHLNFFLPFCIALLWIHPLTKDILMQENTLITITSELFESFRFYVVIFAIIIRFALFREHIQAFLSSGHHVIKRKTTNILITKENWKSLRMSLQQICVMTPHISLEYLAPTFLSLFLLLGLKRKAMICLGVCSGLVGERTAVSTATMTDTSDPLFVTDNINITDLEDEMVGLESLIKENVSLAVPNSTSSQRVGENLFSFLINNSLLSTTFSFFVWWSQFAWFVCCVISLLYIRKTATTYMRGYNGISEHHLTRKELTKAAVRAKAKHKRK